MQHVPPTGRAWVKTHPVRSRLTFWRIHTHPAPGSKEVKTARSNALPP
jgi:hypothetical protein